MVGDPEVRGALALITSTTDQVTLADCLPKFSSWTAATRAIARILRRISKNKSDSPTSATERERVENCIIKDLQKNMYQEEVCSNDTLPRSCSKVCLVRVFPRGQPEHSIKMYAILDDQSNRSLARSEFFHMCKVESNLSPYLMNTCAGTTEMTGRKATVFQIEAVNGGVRLDLPPRIECNEIMTNRSEIPTPDVALAHAHLKRIAPHISKLDPDAEIMILLRRDMIRVHKVREQMNGPHNKPFAQRLDLCWVIVGEVCIDNAHKTTLSVFKTHVLQNGRPSLLAPCQNSIA